MLETHGLQLSSLITELDENFPLVNPSPNEPLAQIMYRSGQRSIVDWIKERITNDNE